MHVLSRASLAFDMKDETGFRILECPSLREMTSPPFKYLLSVLLALLLVSPAIGQHSSVESADSIRVYGTFEPAGPPTDQPVRVAAGGSCIVDLKQNYSIAGTLRGSLEIDYRIVVYGPCEAPPVPGKYDEEWIAHGVFSGTVNEAEAAGTFTYTAQVREGGDVSGRIVLEGDREGELDVSGNFSDGLLSYEGWIE